MELHKVYTITNASICSPNSCKYRFASLQTVFGNHGKPQAALNATAAFFWGDGGMFSTADIHPWSWSCLEPCRFLFLQPWHHSIFSELSFVSFLRGEWTSPWHSTRRDSMGQEKLKQKPSKGCTTKIIHPTRCSLCEFKSHPKSNLFQDNIYLYLFQTLAPSISTTFGVYHCRWNEWRSKNLRTPNILMFGRCPQFILYTLGIILGISQRISRLGILLKQQGLVAKTAVH